MRHQEYRLKAAIDAVSTHYRVSHESKSFSFSKIQFMKLVFTRWWNENRPYYLLLFLSNIKEFIAELSDF